MAAQGNTVEVVAGYLTQTLSQDYNVRKPAEDFLLKTEKESNYSILLLQLAESDQIPMDIRLAAAINFKNFVKRNWRVVDGDSKVSFSLSNSSAVTFIYVFMFLRISEFCDYLSADFFGRPRVGEKEHSWAHAENAGVHPVTAE